jgi:hypothetical protein
MVLLGALLITIIGISSLAFQLVRDQRSMLESAIRDSQQGALELLANRVEHALLGAMQDPFLLLINLPHATAADLKRIETVNTAFPEVGEMLLLDARMKPVFIYPQATNRHRTQFDSWLIQRLVLEETSHRFKSNAFHSFLETLDGQPVLFGFRPASYSVDATPGGWLLIQYNLDELEKRHVTPLLKEFGEEQGGTTLKPWRNRTFWISHSTGYYPAGPSSSSLIRKSLTSVCNPVRPCSSPWLAVWFWSCCWRPLPSGTSCDASMR